MHDFYPIITSTLILAAWAFGYRAGRVAGVTVATSDAFKDGLREGRQFAQTGYIPKPLQPSAELFGEVPADDSMTARQLERDNFEALMRQEFPELAADLDAAEEQQ